VCASPTKLHITVSSVSPKITLKGKRQKNCGKKVSTKILFHCKSH